MLNTYTENFIYFLYNHSPIKEHFTWYVYVQGGGALLAYFIHLTWYEIWVLLFIDGHYNRYLILPTMQMFKVRLSYTTVIYHWSALYWTLYRNICFNWHVFELGRNVISVYEICQTFRAHSIFAKTSVKNCQISLEIKFCF